MSRAPLAAAILSAMLSACTATPRTPASSAVAPARPEAHDASGASRWFTKRELHGFGGEVLEVTLEALASRGPTERARVRLHPRPAQGLAWPEVVVAWGPRGLVVEDGEDGEDGATHVAMSWERPARDRRLAELVWTAKGAVTCATLLHAQSPCGDVGTDRCPIQLSLCFSRREGLVAAEQHFVHHSRLFAAPGFERSWEHACLQRHAEAWVRGDRVRVVAERGALFLGCEPHGRLRFATAGELFAAARAMERGTWLGHDGGVAVEPGSLDLRGASVASVEADVESLRRRSEGADADDRRLVSHSSLRVLSQVGSVVSFAVETGEEAEARPAQVVQRWATLDSRSGRPASVGDFVGPHAFEEAKARDPGMVDDAFAIAAYDERSGRVTLRVAQHGTHFGNVLVTPVDIEAPATPAARPALRDAAQGRAGFFMR